MVHEPQFKLSVLTYRNGKFLDGLSFEQYLLMLNGSLINLGKLINTFIFMKTECLL